MICYCPFSNCAASVTYDTVKPTTCPHCRRTFASAFAIAPAPVAPPARTAVEGDEDDRPLGRASLAGKAPKSATVVKSRPNRPEPSRLMNAPAAVAAPVFPDDGLDDEDEPLDPREVRRQARELAASIDTSAIHVNAGALGEGDKPIRGEVFKGADIWAQGAAAREAAMLAQAAAQPVKVTKRKPRR